MRSHVITESSVEQIALDILSQLKYKVIYGPDIAPDGLRPERRSYADVILVDTLRVLDNAYEIAGTGTIFPDEQNNPVLHMHIACGRKKSTITGCVRKGVKTWHILEVILFELIDTSARRVLFLSLKRGSSCWNHNYRNRVGECGIRVKAWKRLI